MINIMCALMKDEGWVTNEMVLCSKKNKWYQGRTRVRETMSGGEVFEEKIEQRVQLCIAGHLSPLSSLLFHPISS